MASQDSVTWFAALAALLGLWTVATPFVWSAPDALVWSNVAAGAVVAILAGFVAWKAWDDERVHVAVPAVAALVGLWVLVSPFAFESVAESVTYSNVIAGLLAAVLVGYTGYVGSRAGSFQGRPSA